MNYLAPIAILLALAGMSSETSFGQTADPSQNSNPFPELEILKRMDSNRDGFLDSKEIPASAREFVVAVVEHYNAQQAVDEQTGRIDFKLLETLSAKSQRSPKKQPKPPQPKITNRQALLYAANLILLYDKDHNRQLGSEEFKQLSEKWIECDLNLDLQLDLIEVASGIKYALEFPKNPDGTFDQGRSESDLASLQRMYDTMKSELETSPQKPEPENARTSGTPRQFAMSLIATYDKNQNGSLEPSELNQIGPSWATADFDNDGKATVDEIQVRFENYQEQNNRSDPAASPSSIDTTVPKSPASPPDNHASSRPGPKSGAMVSREFHDLDANNDGQIQMHEFAKEFDASVVAEFYQRDASGDGVITKNEWNRFLANQNRTAADPASDKRD